MFQDDSVIHAAGDGRLRSEAKVYLIPVRVRPWLPGCPGPQPAHGSRHLHRRYARQHPGHGAEGFYAVFIIH